MSEDKVKELEAQLKELQEKMSNMYDGDYVKQLRDEAAKHRVQKQEYKAKAEQLDDTELEQFNQWKSDTARQKYEQLIKEGKFDQIEQGYKDKLAEAQADRDKLVKHYEDKIASLTQGFDTMLVNRELTDLASKNGAINPAMVAKLLSDRVKVERDDAGTMNLTVLDGTGQPLKDEKASPVSLEGFMTQIKTTDDYSFMFSGGKNGSGSNTSNYQTSGIKNPFSKESWNLTEQTRLFNEDKALFDRLQEEAKSQQ